MALQHLGVSAAASILNSSVAQTTKKKVNDHDNSGSLYECDEESEDNDQGVVDKVFGTNHCIYIFAHNM